MSRHLRHSRQFSILRQVNQTAPDVGIYRGVERSNLIHINVRSAVPALAASHKSGPVASRWRARGRQPWGADTEGVAGGHAV